MATQKQVKDAWEEGYETGVLAASLVRSKANGTELLTSPSFKFAIRRLRDLDLRLVPSGEASS